MPNKIKCIGCFLQRDKSNRHGEQIFETRNFFVEQDYETPIPGFVIISSKKHIKGIENLSKSQRQEFIELLYMARKAVSKVLKVKYVYIIQKEDTIIARSHFHIWLFPRYAWMAKFGDKIASVTPIIKYARENMKTKHNLDEVINTSLRLKNYFEKHT